MLEPIILIFLFFVAKQRTAPDRADIRKRLERSRDAGTPYFVLRAGLPSAGFGAAGAVSTVALMLVMLGVPQDPHFYAMLIFVTSAALTGVLMLCSVKTAQALVISESGTPDTEARKGLLSELVCFPLIPFITAISLVAMA